MHFITFWIALGDNSLKLPTNYLDFFLSPALLEHLSPKKSVGVFQRLERAKSYNKTPPYVIAIPECAHISLNEAPLPKYLILSSDGLRDLWYYRSPNESEVAEHKWAEILKAIDSESGDENVALKILDEGLGDDHVKKSFLMTAPDSIDDITVIVWKVRSD
jgi:hypothetical protein